jgi:hypothetical protein
MRRVTGTGVVVVACVGFLGVAGFGGVVMGLNAHGGRTADAAPAESDGSAAAIIAARFPSIDAAPSAPLAMHAVASMLPIGDPMLFSPIALSPVTTASIDPVAPPAVEPEARSKLAVAKLETPNTPKTRHATNRPGSVLNDAQIASIRQRLNLTPDQAPLWPAVEAALRKIAYAKNAAVPVHSAPAGAMAYVDANSAEVQELKYAALPLIMRLNDDQRREVKSMAHVMGLENVASQL